MRNRIIASVAAASILSFTLAPAAFSSTAGTSAHLIAESGTVIVRSADKDWSGKSDRSLRAGDSVRTKSDGEAVVQLPDQSVVRIASNSQMELTNLEDDAELDLDQGAMLARANGEMVVSTPSSTAKATHGEFVLKVSEDKTHLEVISGDAHLLDNNGKKAGPADLVTTPEGADSRSLSNIDGKATSSEVAMEGPDVRARDRDRDEFVGGEENTGRGVGEDPSPQPPAPQPQTPPAPQPQTPPAPQPPGPPQDITTPAQTTTTTTPTTGTGGIPPAAIGAGAAGLGLGIIALVANSSENDDDPNNGGFNNGGNLPQPSPTTP